MPMIDFTLRKDHSVLSPNFGDSEIRGIAFPSQDVVALSVWLSVGEVTVTVECRNVRWFAFESNHMQNVIGSVYMYPDLPSAVFPKGVRPPEHVPLQYPRFPDGAPQPVPAQVLVFEPVTGGDLVCICGSVKLWRQDAK